MTRTAAAAAENDPVEHAAPSAGNAFEHGADPGRQDQRRALGRALGVDAGLLVLEVVGGVVFGSLALLADAVHLVSNVAGLGMVVAAVASIGLVVNLGSSVLLHRAQGNSLNLRASFVHLATDALGSLGAMVAGLLILGWGWLRADSLMSLATALLVLWAGAGLLRDTTHVLMEGSPPAPVETLLRRPGAVRPPGDRRGAHLAGTHLRAHGQRVA